MHRPHGGPRVLIIIENTSIRRDRRVWAESMALIEAGYGVTVISPNLPGHPLYEIVDGVHLRAFPPPPEARTKLGFIYEYLWCLAWTAALMVVTAVREGFDAVQACNPPDTNFALALPFKLLGKPFVFDHHDLAPEMYECRYGSDTGLVLACLKKIERATFRSADHVISTNESFREIALTRGGKSADEVTVVRNGPRLDQMRRRDSRPELKMGKRHLCTWLGGMNPLTGVDLALHAVAYLVHQIKRGDCLFAFLGVGESAEQFKQLARDLNLEEWVIFPGWADDEMWAEYLSTSAIAIQPNPKDAKNDLSTAVKTMEYMAFEVPVVAFDLRETRASAGEAALYVTPNDPVAFAEAIDELLDDSEACERMGRIGRDRVEKELAWDHQKLAYVAVYERLLGPPSRNPTSKSVARDRISRLKRAIAR